MQINERVMITRRFLGSPLFDVTRGLLARNNGGKKDDKNGEQCFPRKKTIKSWDETIYKLEDPKTIFTYTLQWKGSESETEHRKYWYVERENGSNIFGKLYAWVLVNRCF